MTRLLFWNIENFGENKINQLIPVLGAGGLALLPTQESFDRRVALLTLIVNVNPDIFILVETEAPRAAVRGQLATNAGSLVLLNFLNAAPVPAPHDWCMVPPVKAGSCECVTVYYRSTNRHFTGPFHWGGGGLPVAAPPPMPGNLYGLPYNNALPGRLIPAGAQYNVGRNENTLAACVDFHYNAAHATPNLPIAYGNTRAPYMVTFFEPAALVPRNLTLFGIHSPARGDLARDYLNSLGTIREITDGQAATELRVIAGDFNYNLLDNADNLHGAYNTLVGAPHLYSLGIAPLFPAPAAPIDGYRTYFATHMTSTRDAKFWSTMAVPAYYPGYGYFSENSYAIDNIFTRYGAGLVAPAPNNFTICNQIVGSPYNAVLPPIVPNVPQGAIGVANATNAVLPAGLLNPAPMYARGDNRTFRDWNNFGKIRSLSDHLALAMDI